MTYTINFITDDFDEGKRTFTEVTEAIDYAFEAKHHGCFAILMTIRDESGKKVNEACFD